MSHTLRSIELYLVRLPLVRPFTTVQHQGPPRPHPGPRRSTRTAAQGWGECASPSDPYYCPETTETCWHILRDFLGARPARRELGASRRCRADLARR